jgi:threonine 3-dehydrogenase
LSIEEVDDPSFGDNDVLIKVEYSSICGTDIHIWSWNEWARSRMRNIPIVIGHEVSGRVVAKGKNAVGVEVGDLVSLESHLADGTCYQCRMGNMHICRNLEILGVDRDGGFAEYVSIPVLNAWVNRGVEPELAAIEEPLGNAVHAIYPANESGDLAGKTVLVLGCGPIGLMSIAVLREIGVEKIFASEISEYRLGFAEKMGADIVINPRVEDVGKIVMDETGGRGVDIVLEMSGALDAIKTGFNVVSPGGRISLLGLPKKDVTIDFNEYIIFRGIRIYGITGRRMFDTWYKVSGLLRRPGFRRKIRSLITHKMNMSDIEEGIGLLRSKEAIKILLKPKFT